MEPAQISSAARAAHELPAQGLGPSDLFCALFHDRVEHAHYLVPARHFAAAALAAATPENLGGMDPQPWLDALIEWSARDLEPPSALEGYGSSWVVRLARELAPFALVDGTWLPGLALSGAVGPTATAALLSQLALELGLSGAGDTRVQRYELFLRSLGLAPDAVARWDYEDMPQCAGISYEQGCLPLALATCPRTFACELVGFNVWAACVGPSALLGRVREDLELRGASLRYLEPRQLRERAGLARRAALSLLDEQPVRATRERLARGFLAAHTAYARWQRGMLAGNVPYTPRELVLEGVRRKARFALDHHREVSVHGANIAALFEAGPSGHERLLDHMASSLSLIRPGAPDKSPFMTQLLSLDGPMFDVFTAAEKNDLREWIAGLGQPEQRAVPRAAVATTGTYVAPQDRAALVAIAQAQAPRWREHGELAALLEELDSNAVTLLAAAGLAADACTRAREAFGEPEGTGPRYSAAALLQLVAELPASDQADAQPPSDSHTAAEARFRRAFLRGVADPKRRDAADFGWLVRRELEARGLPRSAERPSAHDTVRLALCHDLQSYMPEALGCLLAFEARAARSAESPDLNEALAAVQAFFERVRDASHEDVDLLWRRLVWMWRAELSTTSGQGPARAVEGL